MPRKAAKKITLYDLNTKLTAIRKQLDELDDVEITGEVTRGYAVCCHAECTFIGIVMRHINRVVDAEYKVTENLPTDHPL